jgi:MFS family permease
MRRLVPSSASRDSPSHPAQPPRAAGARNVVLLGVTSCLTDVSSEAVTAVLPLYLMLTLRMTPMSVGVLDGIQHGATALIRVAAGLVADARGRHKVVALVGYATSAVCKLGLLLAGGAWGRIATVVLVDRLGKGIRTAPRDALIALSSDPARLGQSFGVHRALDTLGAVLGPAMAFAVLAAAPGAYDAVFVASFAVAVLGLAVLGLFVEERRGPALDSRPARAAVPQVRGVLARPRFGRLVTAGGLLGLLTASDALIYLILQQRGTVPATVFPLLFIGTASVYLLLAVPAGRLGDRWGRHRVFLGGHTLILVLYAALLQAGGGVATVVLCMALLGAYYAATDGVLAALASSVLQEAHLSTGIAIVGTTTGLARLFASSLFGVVWTWYGSSVAVALFAGGLCLSLPIAARLLKVSEPWAAAPIA